jgi:hypothetical protein
VSLTRDRATEGPHRCAAERRYQQHLTVCVLPSYFVTALACPVLIVPVIGISIAIYLFKRRRASLQPRSRLRCAKCVPGWGGLSGRLTRLFALDVKACECLACKETAVTQKSWPI